MSFFDFILYPFNFYVNSYNLGIYRFCFFGFFALWQIFNYKDIKNLLYERLQLDTKKQKKNYLLSNNNLIFYLSITFSILSTIGFLGNISIFIFGLTFCFIQKRIEMFICTTGDIVFKAILLFLFISPCSFSFSVDSLLFTGSIINNNIHYVPGASILTIQYMLILMYTYAGFAKVNDESWINGNIMYTSTNSPLWGKRNIFSKLFNKKFIKIFFSRVIIYYQFFSFLFLPFEDTQIYYAIIGMLIHFGMAITMNLGYFPYVMILGLVSFLI